MPPATAPCRPVWTRLAVAREAAARWPDLDRAALRFVAHGENATWRLTTPDGAVALRIYRPGRWTAEQILVEHDFMRALGSETGVGPPIPACDGETLQAVPGTGLLAAVFPWAAGRIFTRRPDPPRIRRIGRFVGHLHARLLSRPLDGRDRAWDEEALVRAPLRSIRRRWGSELPEASSPHFLDGWAGDWLDRWRTIAPETTLVHADLHLGNLKWAGAAIHPIDFDDCGVAPLAYDLAVPARACGADTDDARFDALIEGYRDMAPGPMDPGHVRLFMAIRLLWEMGWVSDRPELFEPGRVGRILQAQASRLEALAASGGA